MAEQPDSRPDSQDNLSTDGAARGRRGRLRPLAWLGTLSTVVAVATGMFTLRDQILPSDSGSAMASTTSYEQSIGRVCDQVNQTTSEQPTISTELDQNIRAATTALAQRNAVLSAWKQDLGDVQNDLVAFQGLQPVPAALRARQRTTDHAWNLVVTQMREFVEQLENASASDLGRVVRELPALNASISSEEQTRSSGLVSLGGGHCTLSAQLPITIVTLPPLPGAKEPRIQGKPSGTSSPDGTGLGPAAQPTPPVNPDSKTTAPPVNPPTTPPVNPPTTVTPPVNPPTTVTPPVNPTAPFLPPQQGPATVEVLPSPANAASSP